MPDGEHDHRLYSYGEPYPDNGVMYQRYRCAVCGGNTFIHVVTSEIAPRVMNSTVRIITVKDAWDSLTGNQRAAVRHILSAVREDKKVNPGVSRALKDMNPDQVKAVDMMLERELAFNPDWTGYTKEKN